MSKPLATGFVEQLRHAVLALFHALPLVIHAFTFAVFPARAITIARALRLAKCARKARAPIIWLVSFETVFRVFARRI